MVWMQVAGPRAGLRACSPTLSQQRTPTASPTLTITASCTASLLLDAMALRVQARGLARVASIRGVGYKHCERAPQDKVMHILSASTAYRSPHCVGWSAWLGRSGEAWIGIIKNKGAEDGNVGGVEMWISVTLSAAATDRPHIHECMNA